MRTVAIIGTGIMGNGMAENFLKNGHEVFVWNRSKDKLKPLLEKGAKEAPSPGSAAESAELVFEVTANDESSKSVWTAPDGIFAGSTNEKYLFTDATLSISWTDELAKLAADKKLNFFDMPLTGGRIGAETGKLILLVGGDEGRFKEIEQELKSVSEKSFYFGPAGSGMRFKLLLNMLQAIHIAAFGEAMRLGKEIGLDLQRAGAALAERPGGTSTNIAWRDFWNEPDPINFSVEWITKDLSYARKAAEKTVTPMLDEALERYKEAMQNGLDQHDWTVINRQS
jgi:3-hydroxyisobutyrate dehydrogenase-like beta-hydroxyacid dehydrogenase